MAFDHCSVDNSLRCKQTTQYDLPHRHAMSLLHWKCEIADNCNVRLRCHNFGTRCTSSAEQIANSVWASDRIVRAIQPISQSGMRLYCLWWHQPSCMSCNALPWGCERYLEVAVSLIFSREKSALANLSSALLWWTVAIVKALMFENSLAQ